MHFTEASEMYFYFLFIELFNQFVPHQGGRESERKGENLRPNGDLVKQIEGG